jgi:hypothetical protein
VPLHPHSHQFSLALAAGLAAAALAAPPALARVDPPATTPFNSRETDPTAPATPVVVRTVDDGFDWGSAAIGAGGAGALAMVVALGGVAYTTRHRVGVTR